MNFIGKMSAASYVIFDYLKDVIIVGVSFLCLAETFTRNEFLGYLAVLAGALVWQHRKLNPLIQTQPRHRNPIV